jgi:hypothetical protein
MIVGYARVSTDGQTLDAQQAALHEAGATRVFAEKVSGAKTDRQQLAKQSQRWRLAIRWSSASSIGWRDQHAIYSTRSMQSARLRCV